MPRTGHSAVNTESLNLNLYTAIRRSQFFESDSIGVFGGDFVADWLQTDQAQLVYGVFP
jgi:hypothetical protein